MDMKKKKEIEMNMGRVVDIDKKDNDMDINGGTLLGGIISAALLGMAGWAIYILWGLIGWWVLLIAPVVIYFALALGGFCTVSLEGSKDKLLEFTHCPYCKSRVAQEDVICTHCYEDLYTIDEKGEPHRIKNILYVVDKKCRHLYAVDEEGKHLYEIDEKGEPHRKCEHLYGIDKKGEHFYVIDEKGEHRIGNNLHVVDKKGEHLYVVDEKGEPHQIGNDLHVVDKKGEHLYVIDEKGEPHRIGNIFHIGG